MLGLTAPARAQDRLPTAVGSGQAAAFEAQGFPAGGFRIYPSVSVSTSYDDNVLLSDTNKVGDGLVTIAPTVVARSQWSSNMLNTTAFLRDEHYFRRTQQNNDEYGANLDARLDVQRTFSVSGNAGYSHLVEDRGSSGDLLFSTGLINFDQTTASLHATKQINRVTLTGGGSATNYRFDNVIVGNVLVDQEFRDRDVRGFDGRIAYQYSSTTSLFVSGSANRVRYSKVDITGIDRASSGYQLLGGIHFEITRLLSGEVGVGYLSQSFRDPQYSDFGGVSYNANITYAPTTLTTLTFSADRQLTDSALIQVAGVLSSRFAVTVRHELLRNLIVNGNIGYIRDQYRGLDRTDDRIYGGVGARYSFSRYLSAALSYDRRSQSSANSLGREYNGNQFGLTLIAAR